MQFRKPVNHNSIFRPLLLSIIVAVFCLQPVSANSKTQKHNTKSKPHSTASATLVIAGPTNAADLVETFGSMSPSQFKTLLASLDKPTANAAATNNNDADFRRAAWQAQLAIVDDPATCARLQQQAAPILKLFKRDHVVTFFIYLDEYPNMQTLAGTHLGVSTRLLQILKTDSQLNGLVAHQLALQLKSQEYYSASKGENLHRIREIELIADSIAASALQVTSLSAEDYAIILGRMVNYTVEASNSNDDFNHNRHPPIRERQLLIRQINLKQSPVTRITIADALTSQNLMR